LIIIYILIDEITWDKKGGFFIYKDTEEPVEGILFKKNKCMDNETEIGDDNSGLDDDDILDEEDEKTGGKYDEVYIIIYRKFKILYS